MTSPSRYVRCAECRRWVERGNVEVIGEIEYGPECGPRVRRRLVESHELAVERDDREKRP